MNILFWKKRKEPQPVNRDFTTFYALCPLCRRNYLLDVPRTVFLDFKAHCRCDPSRPALNFVVLGSGPDPRAEFACPEFTRPKY